MIAVLGRCSRLLGGAIALVLVFCLTLPPTQATAETPTSTDQGCVGEDCDLPMTMAEPSVSSVDEQSAEAIEQIVHDYLLAHPEVLVEALQIWQAQQAANAKTRERHVIMALSDEIYADPTSPVGGNTDGALTIVEFFDYQCGYCRHVAPLVAQLLQEHNDLRIIYKEFPILGPESLVAARAALASRAQGKYDQFHEALMALEGSLSLDAIMTAAESSGLDVERLAREMDDPSIDAILTRNHSLARRLDIRGTPAFVLDGELIRGAPTFAMLTQLVEEARTRTGEREHPEAASGDGQSVD